MKLGMNHRWDRWRWRINGLDTCVAILDVLHKGLGDPGRACPLLQYVAAGETGRKTGRGFYSYE